MSAVISGCGRYRYRLQRGEGDRLPVVMLNPSTADATTNDPTIRRLLGFASRKMRAGSKTVGPYNGLDVVNLYALRATDPSELWKTEDPYGPRNDEVLAEFCREHLGRIVVAWGSNAKPEAVNRFLNVYLEEADTDEGLVLLDCFGLNKDGNPKHPLYLPYDCGLHPFFL